MDVVAASEVVVGMATPLVEGDPSCPAQATSASPTTTSRREILTVCLRVFLPYPDPVSSLTLGTELEQSGADGQ